MKTNALLASLVSLLLLGRSAPAQLALIRQGHGESPGTAEAGDRFGAAVALGDFDGDGYDDLATGAPLERAEPSSFQSGAVSINYSSAYGIGWSRTDSLTPFDGGYPTTKEAFMGAALAVGDFNADGFDDLAVGLPAAEAGGRARAGLVFIYYGAANGLPGAAQVLSEADFGAALEGADRFGEALAAGRLGTDGYDDLVIGAPGENGSAGAVFIIRGSATGLDPAQTQVLVGGDIGAAAQAGDELGAALAIGDVSGFSWAELIVGAPGADAGFVQNAGAVHVITGTNAGVNPADVRHLDLATVGDFYGSNSRFGHALALGEFYGDGGPRDLAIGAPGRLSGGRVYVGRGTLAGLTWGTTLMQADNAGGDEAGDNFGWALAAGDTDGDGRDELAVGSPGEDIELFGLPDVGWLYVFAGSASGLSQARVTGYNEFDLGDQLGGAGALGTSLAMGRTSRLNIKSIAIGAPLEEGGRGQVFDLAPWRQVPRPLCTSALAADCENHVVYALKPFDRVQIASTTKIMTVLLGCEAIDRPASDPLHVGASEIYTIEDWMFEGFPADTACSVFGDFAGMDALTFENLLRLTFPPSANDGCYAIADAMTGEIAMWNGITGSCPQFVALMNQRAAQIGMTNTHFTNPAGVDKAAYSTAYDMWKLARVAMANPLLREIAGDTDVTIPHLVAQGEAGVYAPGSTQLSYGWLKTMQKYEPRCVGVKPGGTPEAGRTGVAAGRSTVGDRGLAFATGFGWFSVGSGGLWESKLAAMLTLALEECDPAFPGSHPGGPLAQGTWQLGSTAREDALVSSFLDGGAPDGTGTLPGDELTLILYPTTGATLPTVPVRWTYRALWIIPPGSSTGVNVDPLAGYSGTLRNVSDTPGTAALIVTSSTSGGPQTVTLAQGQRSIIPPWQAATGQSAALQFTLRNTGAQPAFIALDGAFDFQAVFTPRFQASLTPLTKPTRESSLLEHREAPRSASGTAGYVLISAGRDQRFFPPIKIDSFQMTRTATSDDVVLLWSTLPALGGLYQDYQIQTTPALVPSAWTHAATVPVQSSGQQVWRRSFPRATQRFFRVLGNLAP